MLMTGAVTLVTWPVALETRSCMRKNGDEAPGHDAVVASWRRRRRLSHGFPISYAVDRLLDSVLSCRSELEVGRLRTVRQRLGQRSSYGFPEK